MAAYDYLFLELNRGPAARADFVRFLAAGPPGLGGKPLGLFVPQLGWEAAQAALLIEREGDGERAAAAIAAAPQVRAREASVLSPTLRPRAGDALAPGGIYVHRWFEVARASLDEFVALSGEAWPDFESRFDARIFGLFEVSSGANAARGADARQLLLITRYASHGVWEESRDPTSAAMQTFARRAQLTRRTRAASTLLVLL